jgi:hypothetical protein
MIRFRLLPSVVLIAAVALLSGCSTYSNLKKSTGNVVRDFRAPDTDLKKTVFRADLNNQVAAAQQDLATAIDSRYRETLPQTCPAIFLTGLDSSPDSLTLNQLVQKISGPTDNLALVRIGKQLGLSAVVTGRFYAIAVRQQDSGFLWFRKKLPFAWISASTEVYDTETGAKYLDQTFTRELKLDDESAESVRKGNVASIPVVEKAVNEIIQEMADAVCDILVRTPWKGFVASVSGDMLTLSAGSSAGLSAGQVLKVYEPGPRIQGAEGQNYLLPGKKVGEVRIATVSSDSADAVIISGSGIKIDDVVKTK